ncbi:hypothetical protein DFH06DRAFT_1125811 [Mycena polygramma]|nr:hypothetical protein DFH06DRAFT_1125811 [Mycena polygramma]
MDLGHFAEAQAHAKDSQKFARISADVYEEANGLHIEATCWYTLGHYELCLSLCHQTRELLASCGMSYSLLDYNVLATQAEVHKSKSEYCEARNIHHQTLQRISVTQDLWHRAWAALDIAEIDVSTDVTKDAVLQNIDDARKIFATVPYTRGLAACDMVLADLTLREGDLLAAKALFSKCLKLYMGTHAEITSYCLDCLGDVSRWDLSAETLSWATVLLVHALNVKQKLMINKALLFLGQIFHNCGDLDTAMNLFEVALEGFTYMGVHRSRAECMLHLGDIYKGGGDLLKAVKLWDTARPLFERSSQSKQVSKIDERLASVGDNLLRQHRKSLARLAELMAPTGTLDEVED